MDEYKYIGKEMILDVIKARGRYLGDAEIMNSMDKTALDQIEGYKKALDSIAEDVENIPPVNVQPVKRGRWLKHHAIWIDQPKIEGWFVQAKCSECEKWAHVMNPYTKSVDYECCPHCGARMDLKDGDTNG